MVAVLEPIKCWACHEEAKEINKVGYEKNCKFYLCSEKCNEVFSKFIIDSRRKKHLEVEK